MGPNEQVIKLQDQLYDMRDDLQEMIDPFLDSRDVSVNQSGYPNVGMEYNWSDIWETWKEFAGIAYKIAMFTKSSDDKWYDSKKSDPYLEFVDNTTIKTNTPKQTSIGDIADIIGKQFDDAMTSLELFIDRGMDDMFSTPRISSDVHSKVQSKADEALAIGGQIRDILDSNYASKYPKMVIQDPDTILSDSDVMRVFKLWEELAAPITDTATILGDTFRQSEQDEWDAFWDDMPASYDEVLDQWMNWDDIFHKTFEEAYRWLDRLEVAMPEMIEYVEG